MKSLVLAAKKTIQDGPFPNSIVPACYGVAKTFKQIGDGDGYYVLEVESEQAAVAALPDCIELANENDKRTTKPTLTGKSKILADAINAKHKAGMTREALVEAMKATK